MFCSKCGNEIKEGDKFCEKCGTVAEVVAEDSTATETVSNEPQAEEKPVETNSTGDNKIEKTKTKSKKKTVIFGALAAMLVLVATCSAFFWEYIENSAVKTFSSPTSYYHYVESKNVSTVSKTAGRFVKMFNGGSGNGYGAQSEFSIQFGEVLLDKIAAETGIDKSDINWLSEAGVKMDTSFDDNLTSANGNITLNGKSVLGMELVFDYETYNLYLRCPQLNEQYALVDLSALNALDYTAASVSVDWSNLPGSEKIEDIVERYLTIAIESLDNVREKTVTLTANGVSQDCTRLTVVVDENSIKRTLKAILREVKSDKDIEEIFKNIVKISGETNADTAYDTFIETVKAAIDNVDEAPIDEFSVEFITWVDSKGDAIGRKIVVEDVDFDFYYYSTHNGSDVGIEAVIGSSASCIKVLGKGTLDGTKMNGDLKVMLDDVDLIDVNIKNYDVDLIEDNYVSGVFTIQLSREACEMLADEIGLSKNDVDSILKCALKIEVDSSEKSSYISVSIVYDEQLVIGITSSSKKIDNTKVKLPESYVLMDEQSKVEDYFSQFDLDKLIQALKEAGVPDSIADSLGDSTGGLDDPDLGFDDDYFYNDDSYSDGFDFDNGGSDENGFFENNNEFQNNVFDKMPEFGQNSGSLRK